MKKHVMIGLGLALLPTLALAAPDFSGTWVRDNAKSAPAGYPTYWLTRTSPSGFAGNQEPVMQVRQGDGTLQVADPVRPQRTYPLDGRAHTRPTDTGLTKATVTATLQADALTIATTEPFSGMPGSVTAKTSETWQVSPDGKVLTITTVRETPAKRQSFNEVYHRR